jgi:T5SS/PEP-CTERM-associated repeat protein
MSLSHRNLIGRLHACLCAAISFFSLAGPTFGQTIIDWNNPAGGSYTTAANWNPANVPDTASETARFNLNAAMTISFPANGSFTIDDLLISQGDLLFRNAGVNNDATLNVSDDAVLAGGHLDLTRFFSDTADVNLVIADQLVVSTSSELSVFNSAQLQASSLRVGSTGAGDGTVLVHGAGTVLTVPASAFPSVVGASGSTGTLTFDGGSTGNNIGTTLTLGAAAISNSKGFLNVLAGSTLQTATINVGTTVSTAPTGQQAFIAVDGAGSSLTMSGAATLTIGSLQNANVEAKIDVTDEGTFSTGTGAIQVHASGTINVGNGSFPGGTFNANGDVLVDGGVINLLTYGAFNLASGRNFTLQNGGTFSSTSSDSVQLSGGSVATVTGVDSAWDLGFAPLDIGQTGAGTLTVLAGGTVSTMNNDFQIGVLTGSNGSVNVSGDDSSLNLQNLYVGIEGVGNLSISSGGAVSSLGGLIGGGDGNGSVAVSGAGSVWANTDDFYVGFFGTGTLDILDGGEVNNTDGLIGIIGDAVGTATVSGQGSLWTNRGDLDISFDPTAHGGGVAGTGVLTIESGGTVFVDGELRVWDKGTLNLHGGTIRFDVLERALLATFNFVAGTIQLAGDRTFGADIVIDDFFGAAPVIPTAKGLTVEGVATLLAPVTLDGGSLSVGQLINAPLLDLKRGTFNLTDQAVTVGVGGLFGDRLRLKSDLILNVDQGTTNNGLIYGSGILGGPLNNTAAGEIRAEAGNTLTFTGSAADNSGDVRLLGGIVDFHGPLSNATDGRITGRGTLVARAGLTNNGHVALSSGITDVYGDVANDTGDPAVGIAVSGNADVTFWGDVTNTSGLFRVSAGSSATFFGGLAGNGISGPGDVYLEADITPGTSPGLATFGGNVHFGPLANLKIELGGLEAGSQFDQLIIAGNAILDGTLDISLIDDFTLSLGDSFEIIDITGTRSGTFAGLVEGATVGNFGGTDLAITYAGGDGNDVSLFVPDLPGDFNLDGTVDAADYVVWRKTDGTPAGYDVWRAHFGQTAGGGAGTAVDSSHAAAPEPTCTLLLILGAAFGIFGRRRGAWRISTTR